MSDFTRRVSTVPGPPPDSAKRVNYTHGLVLGVDEFTQEFAYLSGRTTWLTRDILGYGTASGLQVTVPGDVDVEKGPLVVVAAGTAVSPSGRLIRVASAQQACLDAWLGSHTADVTSRANSRSGSPPSSSIDAHIVLCFREVPEDDRPLPGERCRTDDGPTIPSRVRDDFSLELRFDPPHQREDDASRRFVHWLTQVEMTDAGDDFVTLDEFLGEIRRAAPFDEGGGGTPSLTSPPATMRIRPRDACEYMDAAFRVWVTELRPVSMHGARGSASDCERRIADDDCVLLATLEVPLVQSGGAWRADRAGTIAVREARRPYLVHLRALQQWLLCAAERWSELYGDVTGPAGRNTVERLRNIPIAASPLPADRQVLTFDGAARSWKPAPVPASPKVVSETRFGQAASAGTAADFSRGDHTHGTPPLEGDVTVDERQSTIVRAIQGVPVIATPASNGQVMTFVTGAQNAWRPASLASPTVASETVFGLSPSAGQSATFSRGDHTHGTPPLPDLKGDVIGPIGVNRIEKIQGVAVTATGARPSQVLTFTGSEWQPADSAAAGPFVEHPDRLPRYRIVAAGIVEPLRDTDVRTTYNGLRIVPSKANGQVLVTFDGYKPPPGDPPYRYIVKTLLMSEARVEWFVRLKEPLDATHFTLLVTSGGSDVPVGELVKAKLMIEVSQFFLE